MYSTYSNYRKHDPCGVSYDLCGVSCEVSLPEVLGLVMAPTLTCCRWPLPSLQPRGLPWQHPPICTRLTIKIGIQVHLYVDIFSYLHAPQNEPYFPVAWISKEIK